MDGAGGKEPRGGFEAQRPFQHVLGGNVVAYVHEPSFGTDPRMTPFMMPTQGSRIPKSVVRVMTGAA
jgi:hypothetical protein